MRVVPDAVETDAGPPLSIPLAHFLAALPALVGGTLLVVAHVAGRLPVDGRAVVAHLLLVGFVCVTIAGALTQFVPVWSGVALHSRRLARWQGRLLVVGLLLLAGGLWTVAPIPITVGGVLLLCGFWLLCYNVGRTLWTAAPWDRTERHFLAALGFLVLASVLGVLLAVGYATPVWGRAGLGRLGLDRLAVRSAHLTLAVFGVVIVTIVGALSQLVAMFTQTDADGHDRRLQWVASVAFPVGVVLLAAGRLASAPNGETVGRLGGVVLCLGLAAALVAVGRRLLASVVPFGATLRRYVVVVVAGLGWVALALPTWLAAPTAPTTLLGPPVAVPLLVGGVIGHVVVGTLYHVVPFLVWVEVYSDRLGYEPVPSVDDLYDGRVAVVDLCCSAAGVTTLVAAGSLGWPTPVVLAGLCLLATSAVLASANLIGVVVRHDPAPLRRLLPRWVTAFRS
ncbi:hypothetical protein RYH80_15130 [Halobaculum sp. MBLA0147]|uniref:hypothetical protein n=1 Tax=Halobaculum sp. MBLA0147 TaxID=3079934 RepID=UPI003525DEE6